MATINLGRIKPVNKGVWSNSTAYAVDDFVQYTDNGIVSTYIAVATSTNQAPSTSGTENSTYWKFMAKGVASELTGLGNNKLVTTDGSGNIQAVSIGTAGQSLKVNSGANGFEFGTISSNVDMVQYSALDSTGVNTITINTDWATNNYWKMEVFCQYQMSTGGNGIKMYWRNSSGNITSQTYGYMGYYSHAQTNHNGSTLALSRDVNGGLDNMNLNGWGYNSSLIDEDFQLTIYKPDSSNRQKLHKRYLNQDNSSPPYYAHYSEMMWSTDTSAKTGFSIVANGGANLKNGFIVIMGHKYQ